ncbi:MAG: dTDP-glucose 4,6-dehydratase [Candidatus Aminicenantia bacterium]
MKTILVTGGCGFIFSHFIRYILNKYQDYKIINLDLLTYAGQIENTKDFKDNERYRFRKGDICNEALVDEIMKKVDYVVHGAAASHVDRSIMKPNEFLRTNVLGTQVLLNRARQHNIERFVHIGSDEEYGSTQGNSFKETDPLCPSNPYSSSKAAASLLAISYFKSYHLPVIITRSSNNFGPNQYPEKLIPLFITNLIENKKIPLYGDGLNVRDWLYVLDNCRAIDMILHKGKEGEIYNVGGGNEKTNLETTRFILEKIGRDESYIQYVKDRPGHDRRYSLDFSKIKEELGWQPEYDFGDALSETIQWYKNNEWWWKKIKSGEYLEYYKKQYQNKIRTH